MSKVEPVETWTKNKDGEPVTIDPTQGAILTSSDGTLELIIPDYGKDEIVPPNMLFLMGCFQRSQRDPTWATKIIGWEIERLRKTGHPGLVNPN